MKTLEWRDCGGKVAARWSSIWQGMPQAIQCCDGKACGLCRYVEAGLLWSTQDRAAAQRQVTCVEDTHWLRSALPSLGLVAFVGNGSILPRCTAHSSALNHDADVRS